MVCAFWGGAVISRESSILEMRNVGQEEETNTEKDLGLTPVVSEWRRRQIGIFGYPSKISILLEEPSVVWKFIIMKIYF